MSDKNEPIFLAKVEDVNPECGLRVELPDWEPIAVFRLGDEFFATDDACTHGAASLSEGEICDGQVECPFHGGSFDIRTGKATAMPCTRPLRVYPVTLENDCIYARIASGAGPAVSSDRNPNEK